LYTFRLIFMTFHGPERFRQAAAAHAGAGHDAEHGHGATHGSAVAHGSVTGHTAATAHGSAAAHGVSGSHAHDDHGHDDHHGHGPVEPHESPLVVTIPLIALAIPSVLIGALTVGPILFGGYFGDAIRVLERNDVLTELGKTFQSPTQMALHGFLGLPFWLAAGGVLAAWAFFLYRPQWADAWARALAPIRTLLINKYYFDWFNEKVISAVARGLGFTLWKGGDQVLIDGVLVNGSAATVGWFGSIVRRVQNGYLYSYAFWMVIGLAVLLGWFLVRS
jgi:NADH-quinone oxidoreductase subunit L